MQEITDTSVVDLLEQACYKQSDLASAIAACEAALASSPVREKQTAVAVIVLVDDAVER